MDFYGDAKKVFEKDSTQKENDRIRKLLKNKLYQREKLKELHDRDYMRYSHEIAILNEIISELN